ncbi:MAG TPA: FkbM family methyltransferase [Candidatus Krumholzibacteria bacterium]|nr:FkbM family methyltransferase [Candidatus Krumholzibacteria bacterium]
MPSTSFLQTAREWRARRRLVTYLRAHQHSRAVVEFRGCRFFAGLDNKIEASLLRGERGYDHANFTAATHFVRPGHVCFDIGANIGVYSVVMARLSGSAANVHAFEPVEHIRERLLGNAGLNGYSDLRVNAFALGAEAGSLEMFQVKRGHFRGGTSTFLRNENVATLGEGQFETRTVQIRTLDHYVAEAGLARVDFMKIDVEGFELPVLEGAARTVARFHPVVLMEYDEARHGRQGHGDKLRTFLNGHGYHAYEFTSFGDDLVLSPFDFSGQPRNRNLLCTARTR